MKKLIACYLLFLWVITACNKKEYPKDSIESNDAMFFSKLLVNGNALTLEAGKNSYYMYSSFSQDSTGVYRFTGELKANALNSNTLPSVKIQINDSKISVQNAESNANASLKPGTFNYFEEGYSALYGIAFASVYNKNSKSYFWDFGDGTTSTEANPVHYFKGAGSYNTCLNIEGSNTCNSSICNVVNSGIGSFNTYITSSNLAGNQVAFTYTNIGGKAPFTCFWSFGDDSSSQLPNPVHKYKYTGSYAVSLRIKDADQRTNLVHYNVVTGADLSSCAANTKITSVLTPIQYLGLSEVTISYTDEKGIVYTSKTNTQSNSSAFTITSVEEFEANEKGEKTKKIHVRFTCKVYAGSQSINLEGTDAVFAFAYK